MRTVTLELAGETFDMPVNFAAGSELSKAGHDPLKLAMGDDLRSHMTAEAVITILHIGVRATGSKLSINRVGEAVYEIGALSFLPKAIEYISAFVAAQPEHPVRADPKDQASATH